MTPKELSIAARYVRDCVVNAQRMQERLLKNDALTADQRERLSRVAIHTEAADEFNRLAAVDSPLAGSDTKPLPAVADGAKGIADLLNEACKTMPRITSLPESQLGGSVREAARTAELIANQARGAIQTYLAG